MVALVLDNVCVCWVLLLCGRSSSVVKGDGFLFQTFWPKVHLGGESLVSFVSDLMILLMVLKARKVSSSPALFSCFYVIILRVISDQRRVGCEPGTFHVQRERDPTEPEWSDLWYRETSPQIYFFINRWRPHFNLLLIYRLCCLGLALVNTKLSSSDLEKIKYRYFFNISCHTFDIFKTLPHLNRSCWQT